MTDMNLSRDRVKYAAQPTQCLRDQLEEVLHGFEKMRRGDFDPIHYLDHKSFKEPDSY